MKKMFKYMENILHLLLAVLFLSMTILIAVQVTSRYVFHSPITWIEESVRYIFIWSVMTGAVAAMAKDKHLNVDLLSEKLSLNARLVQQILIRLVAALYFICLTIGGFQLIRQVAVQLSATLRISMAVPYSAIAICAAIMAVQELCFIITAIRRLTGKGEIGSSCHLQS